MLIMFIILITKPTFDNKKLENFDFWFFKNIRKIDIGENIIRKYFEGKNIKIFFKS